MEHLKYLQVFHRNFVDAPLRAGVPASVYECGLDELTPEQADALRQDTVVANEDDITAIIARGVGGVIVAFRPTPHGAEAAAATAARAPCPHPWGRNSAINRLHEHTQ